MRTLLAAALLLLTLAPGAVAAPEAPQVGLPIGVHALGMYPALDDPALAFFAQLEMQGALPRGTVEAAMMAAAPRPPGIIFRDAHATCDLDADGVEDVIVNALTLRRLPGLGGSFSEIQAISGANGSLLWKVDNLVYRGIQSPQGVQFSRVGAAEPGKADNAQPTVDLDGDGACDLFAYGYEDGLTSISDPFFNSVDVSAFTVTVRAISGANGRDVWSVPYDGQTVFLAQDPFLQPVSETTVTNFPTGILAYAGPEGPRIVVKTTDLKYVYANSLLAIPTIPNLPPVLRGSLWYQTIRVDDHVSLLDGVDGKTLWTHEVRTTTDAPTTNVTWISGVADLDGDASLDVVLDQFTLSNPRGTEMNRPGTTDPLFRYGRGVSALAIKGEDGLRLWSTMIVDPEQTKPNLPVEDNRETIVWARAQLGPDVDGDSYPDVIESFVVQEENLGASVNGAFRTHFVSLSGANGTQRFDVRQQGWGVLRPVGGVMLGMGMVDVPTAAPPGGRFPPKFLRMGVLDGADGSSVWSYEKSFGQNSFFSYNLALAQYEEALAPIDLNHDGTLDLITPAQYAPAAGRDQVLLATSTHSYEVRSGVDGSVLATIPVWGPDGRVVACGGNDLTLISGHGRRFDFTRYDPAGGTTTWRRPVFNDPAPHAATSGVDVLGVAATCATRADGTTILALNANLFSGVRGLEVVPVLGALRADGSPVWMTPEVQGNPSTDEQIFQASIRAAQQREQATPWPGVAIGSALGALAAFFTIIGLRKGTSSFAKVLGIAMVLVVLAPGGAALVGVPGIPVVTQPQPASLPTGAIVEPAGQLALLAPVAREGDGGALLLADESTSFTYDAGDIDGDGVQDLLVDLYCQDFDRCDQFIDLLDPAGLAASFTETRCGLMHRLYGVSGANHSALWSVDLDVTGHWLSCGASRVIGTVPTADGLGVLVHRGVEDFATQFVRKATHDVTLYSVKSGEAKWTHHEDGVWAYDLAATQVSAENWFVNPQIVTGATSQESAIFIQSVGYVRFATATWPAFTLTGAGGLDREPTIARAYFPREWAARLDIETGEVSWKSDTFQESNRSVYPTMLGTVPNDDWRWGLTQEIRRSYWEATTCCGDLTGDGVPDLAFKTLEWNPTPNANVNGPFGADARLVIFDGSTGARALDQFVRRDIDAPLSTRAPDSYTFGEVFAGGWPTYGLEYQTMGATPEGPLVLQRETLVSAPYTQVVSVVNTKTGAMLWNTSFTRDSRDLVLGDADDDGVNDILIFDWFSHDGGRRKTDAFGTPADVPLVMRSGKDGHELWRTTTYSAPADIISVFDNMARNGLPDLNGDGVFDFTTDDPEYLGEQTTIHHISFRSGKDASVLWTTDAVGAFAIPSGVGKDIALISGDLNDLWVTIHRGADGAAVWSRRLMALPASTFAEALPLARFHELLRADGAPMDIVTDFHVDITAVYFFNGVCIGCDDSTVQAGQSMGRYSYTAPTVLAMNASLGQATWAMPPIASFELESFVAGLTPGTQMYHRVLEEGSPLAVASQAAPIAIPAVGAFVVVYAVIVGIAIVSLRYARKFVGVPDLE